MTKDERIQGLIEANNLNIEKRRRLARALRLVQKYIPNGHAITHEIVSTALAECSGE